MAFKDNLEGLEKAVLSASFDILSALPVLSDEEILKNILAAKSPGASAESINLMVDGPQEGTVGFEGVYPLAKTHPFYEEVAKLKTEVRAAGAMFMKEQAALVQEVILLGIQVGTSVSASVVFLAPLSFNLPAAVSIVLELINSLSKLIDRALGILPAIDPLKKLEMLLPKNGTEALLAPLNVAISAVSALIGVLGAFKKIIESIFGGLKSLISPSNLESQREDLRKLLAEKEQELADAIKDNASQKKRENLNATISEIRQRLGMMENGMDLPSMENGRFSESALKNAFDKFGIGEALNTANATVVELQRFVYDVYLPDGTLVPGISEEELQSYKEKYTLLFK